MITVMLSLQGTPAIEPIRSYASFAVLGHGEEDDASGGLGHLSDREDLWEELESEGEIILSFPSQIEAAISSPDDEDSFSFRLEEKTDLTVQLDSEYPCGLELISKSGTIGVSKRPGSQLLESAGLEAGSYTLCVTPQEGIEASSYTLRIFRQADRTKRPDYSEAHIAGTMFDPESPFRFYNVQNEAEKNKSGSPVHIIHYLAHWQGPVKESVMPYYDKGDFKETPSDYIHYKEAEPEFHEQNVIVLPGYDNAGDYMEHWKNAIMTYGAIDTGLYSSYNFRDVNPDDGFPKWDFRYFYAPKDWEYEKLGGHAVLVVGWDDTVEKEKFRVTKRDMDYTTGEGTGEILSETMPEHDGAWICRDSYGDSYESFPDYYYISYESADFGEIDKVPSAFAPSESSDNYNHLYSNSAGGIDSGVYEGHGFLRGSQVFHSEGTGEVLKAVGLAVQSNDVSYEIGVRIGDGTVQKIKSGYLKYAGFYTVRLEDGIMIPADTDFEVHVAISSDESRGLSFYSCHDRDGWINGTKAIPGKSFYYVSWDEEGGKIDVSAEGEYPCIYAYTYSPLNSEITILDNKEKAATMSDADADPDAEKVSDVHGARATPSEADRTAHETKATLSEAGMATASDGEYAADPDEMVLEDDREETRRAEKEEAQMKAVLNMLRRRAQKDGIAKFENAAEMETAPLSLNFPAEYNSRDYNLITKAKHQGNSNLCWAFSAVGALEASYLRYGNQLINYPRGVNLISQEDVITDGTISLKLKKGQEIPLNLSAALYSDSDYFNPGSPQIYWEITGDLGSVEAAERLSESGEELTVLTAKTPGNVTVTAVSMADVSLRAACRIEITESAPAKVRIQPESLTMKVGEMHKLETTVEAEEELSVLFSSDRPDIVSVDKDGQVLALKPGTALVTAKAGDGQAVCRITVRGRAHSENDSGESAGGADRTTKEDTVHGSWEQDGVGWRFVKDDGTYARSSWEKIGGVWYWFKEDSFVASGWLNQGDIWYYLSQDAGTYGKMATDWFYDPSYQKWFYLEESGAMAMGWKQIDGKWYYFHTVSDGLRGRMYAGERTPDGFMTGADGAWIP